MPLNLKVLQTSRAFHQLERDYTRLSRDNLRYLLSHVNFTHVCSMVANN